MPDFTNVSIAAPSQDAIFVAQPEKHSFYLKAFSGGASVTTFAEGDNYADDVIGALPFSSAAEAAELIALSGKRFRGDRTITAENQTARIQVFLGQEKHTRLYDRLVTRKKAPFQGAPLAFVRGFPDGLGVQGVAYVENMVGEGDPGADAFGYDFEFSFDNEFDYVDIRAIPVYTSATPAGGPAGTVQTVNGQKLTSVTRVEFRTAGGVVTQSVTNFTTQSATQLVYATPAGLTNGTTYNRFLLAGGTEVAAGTFAASA